MINAKPAVICLTETWLDNTVTSSEISIDGYSVVRKDRNRNGGGVCTYIRSDIAFSEVKNIPNEDIETTWIELLLPKTKPILIGTCYRPPNQYTFLEINLKIF